jgi:hypothetical protein
MDPKSISCSNWEERLTSVDEDDLSHEEREALDQHIASCQSCATLREEFSAMRVLIRDLPITGPQPAFPDKLRQLWEAEKSSDDLLVQPLRDGGLDWRSGISNRPGNAHKQKLRRSMPHHRVLLVKFNIVLAGVVLLALPMLFIALTTTNTNSLNSYVMVALTALVGFLSSIGATLGIVIISDRVHMLMVHRELRELEIRLRKQQSTTSTQGGLRAGLDNTLYQGTVTNLQK